MAAPAAIAGPTGGTVVGGEASIAAHGAETLIHQGSAKAVINWNSYSVAPNESVIYQQPGASSIALNRVLGGAPSQILGSIQANGQVWLVNPNGVFFGRGATVNVAGLLATTADIANNDFLAGNYNFGTPSSNPNAAIVNNGTIIAAAGGSAVLAAPSVDNEGVIEARLGTVALGAGKTFALDFDGDNLLRFQITSADDSLPLGPDGKPVSALAKNAGSLKAGGGTVEVTALAARDIVDNVINTTGIVEADSVAVRNGTVILSGTGGGVAVGGTVSAAGKIAGSTGGTVKVLGDRVTMAAGATIDVSGAAGGGTVLIGGDTHGAGPDANSATTTIAKGATIDADATRTGNGGEVAVWSEEDTTFDGTITARGGPGGGNGGQVETSSAGNLTVGGFVDTLAPKGETGNWLLDPTNITVASSGSATLAGTSSYSGDAGDSDTITASTIDNAASNVTLQASNQIEFAAPISMATTGFGLTADADSVLVDTGSTIATKGGAITLAANAVGSNQSGTGTLELGANLSSAGGAINLSGPTVLTGNVTIDSATGATNGGAGVTFAGTLDDSTRQTHDLIIAAGSGDVTFAGRVGIDDAGSGTDPGNVAITSAADVNMTMPYGTGGDGFAAKSFTIAGNALTSPTCAAAGTGCTPGATGNFNDDEYIVTVGSGNAGNVVIDVGGAVTDAGNIVAYGNGSNANGSGGKGGLVSIEAGGAVSIYECCTLGSRTQSPAFVPGTDDRLVTAYATAISTFGGEGTNSAGNGGPVTIISGGDIDLGFAVNSSGTYGSGSKTGGDAGAITLTAPSGRIEVGNYDGNGNLTSGNIIGLFAVGGGTDSGTGGNGAPITVTAQTILLPIAASQGGDSEATQANGGAGGNGGDITLIATASSGAAVTLYGEPDDPQTTFPLFGTLIAAGGTAGASIPSPYTSPLLLFGGTLSGKSGNITIAGNSSGAPLAGTSFIQLVDDSAASQYYGGPTVAIAANGAVGEGGAIYLGGPVESTLGTENLRLFADNGSATIAGPVGDQVAFNDIVLGCCGVTSTDPDDPTYGVANPTIDASGSNSGAITFDGSVTATNISDERLSDGSTPTSLTMVGKVTTADFSQVSDYCPTSDCETDTGNVINTSFLDGAVFSGILNNSNGGTLAFSGDFVFTSTFQPDSNGLTIDRTMTLAGDTTLDASAVGADFSIGRVGANPKPGMIMGNGHDLTVDAGPGAITLANNGTLEDIAALTLDGGAITLNTDITTVGALTLNAGAGTITDTGAVNVGAFILAGGNWSQVAATLPAFSATDFELQGGTFVRALGGDGTSGNPYQIADVYGLQGIGTLLADNFVLANDIGASASANWNGGAGFMPIGNDNTGNFSGSLNGQGYTVSGLTIVSPFSNVGLFGTNAGTIANLIVANAQVTSTDSNEAASAGTLAGTNTGTIDNSSATGSVVGGSSDGGDANLGGLVGYNNGGTINGGSFATVVVADDANYGDDSLGGFVGRNDGTIVETYATGTVTGTGGGVANGWGGLVGTMDGGSIDQSFATGIVTNNSTSVPNLGGLVGTENDGTITNSYASGAVISLTADGATYIGGLVGWQIGGSIANSYATGLVQCPNNGCSQGGLVGVGGGTVDGLSFWDVDTSEQSVSDGGVGLTTAQAHSASYLAGLGWTFAPTSTVWAIENGTSYPYLRWYGSPAAVAEIVSGLAPAGAAVDLLINGAQPQTTIAAANGVYDFILTSGTGGAVLVFLPSGSANAVSQLAQSGAGGLTLTTDNLVYLTGQGNTVSTSNLATALGTASATGILYGVSGTSILLSPGVALNIAGGSGNVVIDDAIAGAGGTIDIAGPRISLGANVTATGIDLAAPVSLAVPVTLDGGTGTVTLGTVDTGANAVTVVADGIALTGAWSGTTGARTLYPFTAESAVTLAPKSGTTPAAFNLDASELADLAGGAPSLVTIGSAVAPATGPLTTGDFVFDAPLELIGSNMKIDPLVKNSGALTLVSSGPVVAAIDLAAGTGFLDVTSPNVTVTGTINGASGAAAAQYLVLLTPGATGSANGVAAGTQPTAPSTITAAQVNPPQNGTITSGPTTVLTPSLISLTPTPLATAPAQTEMPIVTMVEPTSFTLPEPANPELTGGEGIATVGDLDTGAAMFQTISPTTGGDLRASSSSASDSTLSEIANPPPVKPAEHATAPPPRTVQAVAAYLNKMLTPTVPRPGVPGISFGYSLSGNSATW